MSAASEQPGPSGMLLGSIPTTQRFLLPVSLTGADIRESGNDFPKAPGPRRI